MPKSEYGSQEYQAWLYGTAVDLLETAVICRDALLTLSHNPAFEDDAPEFNEGGVGHEACRIALESINKATKELKGDSDANPS